MMLLSHAVTWVARQAANWYMYMEGLPLQHEVLLITQSAASAFTGDSGGRIMVQQRLVAVSS